MTIKEKTNQFWHAQACPISIKPTISSSDIVLSYTAAVRVYHHYKQLWKPIRNEELCSLHEKFSFYDSFAVKTVSKNGNTVGHFPRQLSWVTNFFWIEGFDACQAIFTPLKTVALDSRRDGNSMYCVQLAEQYLQVVKERLTC